MNVYLPNLRLPSEYQEVEWIGRNGNNYIDTGWIPIMSNSWEVQIGYKVSSGSNRYAVLGNYNAQAGNISLEITAQNQGRFYMDTGGGSTGFATTNTISTSSFNEMVFKNNLNSSGTVILNGTSTSGTIYTGGYYNASAYIFIDRKLRWTTFTQDSYVSYCKIYEAGTLVRDFVPCYRKSDSVIGLYDIIGKQFYTNQGTGTFSKGNDVTMAELKNAYIGEYTQLQQIFDFSTSDLHGFTYRTTSGNGLTIDTTNRYCTDNNPGYGCYYKQVNYKKCRQRIKGKLTGGGSLMCGVGKDYAPSSGFSCSLGFDNSKFFVGIKGMSSYSTISSPSGFNGAEWHYYDTIWDNGSVTVKVLNLDESVVVSNTYTATETTQKYIGFCGGSYPNRAMYISEYRLAYEE